MYLILVILRKTKNNYRMKNGIIYVALLVIMSCGPKVTTEKMSSKDLGSFETFAYLPNSNFDEFNKFEDDNTVGLQVIDNINQNMKKQGYDIDRDNPDLLVLLSTMTDVEKTVTREPVYARYPRYYNSGYAVSPYYQNYYYYDYNTFNNVVGYETDVNKYKEGTLVLNLVDSATKNVIWKGTASDLIFKQNESKAISKFVDDMFEKFPKVK